jgi:hypothetical protein
VSVRCCWFCGCVRVCGLLSARLFVDRVVLSPSRVPAPPFIYSLRGASVQRVAR